MGDEINREKLMKFFFARQLSLVLGARCGEAKGVGPTIVRGGTRKSTPLGG